jgi:hypothetical protein
MSKDSGLKTTIVVSAPALHADWSSDLKWWGAASNQLPQRTIGLPLVRLGRKTTRPSALQTAAG